MEQQEFEKVFAETIETIKQLLVVKGGEYAGSEDRLANFKRGAALTGATPLQVAFIYASKHYDAVATFVRDRAKGVERLRSEGIEGRLADLINYCILMKALIEENEAEGYKAEKRGKESAYEEWIERGRVPELLSSKSRSV